MSKCLPDCGVAVFFQHMEVFMHPILSYHLEGELLLEMDLACCRSGLTPPYACSGRLCAAARKRFRWAGGVGGDLVQLPVVDCMPLWLLGGHKTFLPSAFNRCLISSSTEQAIWAASTVRTSAVKHGAKAQ